MSSHDAWLETLGVLDHLNCPISHLSDMADTSTFPSRSTSPISNSGSPGKMTKSTVDSTKSSKRKGKSAGGGGDGGGRGCRPRGQTAPRRGLHVNKKVTAGTRSVSTLTPAQLARKRANDREAQRAIRARTKEHIENLEREIEELRSSQSRDETVRNLLRRNKALEDELQRMRESMGITSSGPRSMYHQSGKPPFLGENAFRARADDGRPAAYHSPGSRASPLAQGSSEYPGMHDIPSYDHMTSSGEPWSSTVSCAVPSTVSSPSSSGATDELGSAYYPTSAPASLLDRSGLSSSMNSPTASCISGKLGYEDIKTGKSGVLRRGTG